MKPSLNQTLISEFQEWTEPNKNSNQTYKYKKTETKGESPVCLHSTNKAVGRLFDPSIPKQSSAWEFEYSDKFT